jgi:hypothetical protein
MDKEYIMHGVSAKCIKILVQNILREGIAVKKLNSMA